MPRRPPVYRCPRCGGDTAGFDPHQVCRRCRRELADESPRISALRARMIEARRQAKIDELEGRDPFPEGF